MKVSLVMTTFNRAEQLNRGLTSIYNQTVFPDFLVNDEIVIIDDGSTDNTKNIVSKWQALMPIRYFNTGVTEHRISAIPRNIAIKKAMGDIILFTEPEMLHLGDNMEKMLKNLKPDNFVLATQVWTIGETAFWQMTDEEIENPELILNNKNAMLVSGNMQNTKASNSDSAITGSINCYAGCFFGVYKKNLLKVGGFDESFEGHGWDDWDLFHRLELAGIKEKRSNDIIVFHQWHKKDYPYNIYEYAEKNGKKSEANIKAGIYEANQGKEWGQL